MTGTLETSKPAAGEAGWKAGRQVGGTKGEDGGGEQGNILWKTLLFFKNSLAAVGLRCWARLSLLVVSRGYSSLGSSRTRDQTRVPCIGRWILIH